MKYMINNSKFCSGFLIAALLIFINFGCTKNFEKYNTSNLSVSVDMASAFKHIMMAPVNFSGGGDPNSYQVQQNLSADAFSGYHMCAHFGAPNNMTYALNPGWNGEMFKVGYLDGMRYVSLIKNMGVDTKYPAAWAVAQIMQIECMHRVTDYYGPIPYSHAGPLENGQTGSVYDSQQDVYNEFFLQLDTIVTNLKAFISSGQKLPFDFSTMDLIYGNNPSNEFQNWLSYANSLRLRLAIRISNVDPATAKIQGEKALDPNNGGVLTDNSQIVQVQIPAGNFSNPLVAIAKNWVQTNIGASIQCYMTGYKDPRIGKYMDTCSNVAKYGKYRGIRVGTNPQPNESAYSGYSTINFKDGATPSFNLQTPVVLMTTAEVYFLRAEAALRNWSNAGGTADQLYEQGVQTSFNQWNAGSATTYLNDNTSVPDAYNDPLDAGNNASSPSSITVKWDDNASNEQKLERIITQKWIANFPEGMEGWTEFRRTGYPKLFPVVINSSGGTINTAVQIRRIPFSQDEYTLNNAEVIKAIQLLSTPADNGGTRLWWDTGKPNF